jgi:hypothetical protein
VHYVGGTEEEDEWVDLNSGRLRVPTYTAQNLDYCDTVRAHKRLIVQQAGIHHIVGALQVHSVVN